MHTYSIIYITFVISMFILWNWLIFIKIGFVTEKDSDLCFCVLNMFFLIIYLCIGLSYTIEYTEPQEVEIHNILRTKGYVTYQRKDKEHVYTETEAKFVNNDFKIVKYYDRTLLGIDMECTKIKVIGNEN